jgi:hypothetical protein
MLKWPRSTVTVPCHRSRRRIPLNDPRVSVFVVLLTPRQTLTLKQVLFRSRRPTERYIYTHTHTHIHTHTHTHTHTHMYVCICVCVCLVPQEEAKARGFRRLPVHEVSVYKVSPGSDGTNSSSPDTPPTTAPHIFGAKSPSKFVSEPHPDEYRPNVVFYPHRSHSSSPTNSDGVDAAAKPKSTQERRGARSLTIRCA